MFASFASLSVRVLGELALRYRDDVELARYTCLVVLASLMPPTGAEAEAEIPLFPAPRKYDSSGSTSKHDSGRFDGGVVEYPKSEVEHRDQRIPLQQNLSSKLFERFQGLERR